MNQDEARLYAVICYAGSEAGGNLRREFLDEIARLRRVEAVSRDAVNIALNDAGPAAFETMAELRALLSSGEANPIVRRHTEDLEALREAVRSLVWTIERDSLWPENQVYQKLISAAVAKGRAALAATDEGRRGPMKKPRDPKDLWHRIENEMASFETGSDGFFALPSGHPITSQSAAKRFMRVAKWADEAWRALQSSGKTGGDP